MIRMGILALLAFGYALMPVMATQAKDPVSPKKGAIPNGFFVSNNKDALDFAIVRCRQSHDVLKCHVQLLETTRQAGGICEIAIRQMREDLPWTTEPLDSSDKGHWLSLRESSGSKCAVERRMTFSPSQPGGRYDLLRFKRVVTNKDADPFCQSIPELDELWTEDPALQRVPDCTGFMWKQQ